MIRFDSSSTNWSNGSSRISNLGFLTMALAKIIFLAIDDDMRIPPGYKMVSKPFDCSLIKSLSPTFSIAQKMASSKISALPKVMFSRIVPSKGVSSIRDKPICDR